MPLLGTVCGNQHQLRRCTRPQVEQESFFSNTICSDEFVLIWAAAKGSCAHLAHLSTPASCCSKWIQEPILFQTKTRCSWHQTLLLLFINIDPVMLWDLNMVADTGWRIPKMRSSSFFSSGQKCHLSSHFTVLQTAQGSYSSASLWVEKGCKRLSSFCQQPPLVCSPVNWKWYRQRGICPCV